MMVWIGRADGNEDTEEADEKQENPMEQAALMPAAQYDYDGAIELLKKSAGLQKVIRICRVQFLDYENTKATCTEYPLE